MTLGSLFDGIGGFPYVGAMCGITPLWASEIEAAPVSITKRHFPDMLHLGDITKINGAAIPPVDIITFGSPCQDLSVANGNRKGLDGERSGLFIEAIRIIKEMRSATDGKYPTFIVWENVPGAYSSNRGEDFRTVLEEICRAVESGVSIPRPPGRKWESAGSILGDKYSAVWRTLDAQYWGVPQRRRRIYLVCDFGGKRAGEILFERDGVPWDIASGATPGEGTAENAESGVASAVVRMRSGCEGGGKGALVSEEKSFTLATGNDQVLFTAAAFNGNAGAKSGSIAYVEEGSPMLKAEQNTHVMLFEPRSKDGVPRISKDISPTKEQGGQSLNYINPVAVYGIGNGQVDQTRLSREKIGTLNCMHDQQAVMQRNTVRRLMPVECEALQGYPDHWTAVGHDGKQISDSARYRALGNSLALPCAWYVVSGIAEILKGEMKGGKDRTVDTLD